ncbi:MAG: hypothetical protein HY701_14765 [Gemmatimonadetes bacterium]|nr:hypothetical protein [Gemmatimonadota bacterium]
MREHTTETRHPTTPPAVDTARHPRRTSAARGLPGLIVGNADEIVERWSAALSPRSGSTPPEVEDLLTEFQRTFVSMIPLALGPRREQIERIWTSTAELYGSLGAMRGLAAGEVVEEFQFLRETVIRVLYRDVVGTGLPPISLRELLRLNRFLDGGVTRASVGHTDTLYFSWLRGSGIPDPLTPEMLKEIRAQLVGLRQELEATGV